VLLELPSFTFSVGLAKIANYHKLAAPLSFQDSWQKLDNK